MSGQVAIELNDNGIIVSDGQLLLLESPGYIIDLVGQEWIGKEARNRAQLHPNECSNRFWSELAQTQVNAVNQSNAKLALRHLASVWQKISLNAQTVILTVPATFTKTGLGLLLGICKELSIPVCAMIHQAVLVPRQFNHTGATIHLDMQLHNTAITLLQEQDNEFSVSAVELLKDIGFVSIYTLAAEYIAQVFISETRLDPMHSAELEQQLFDFLPTWLEQAQSRDAVQCQLEYQNNTYEVIINAQGLKEILKPILNKIIKTLLSFDAKQAVIACVPEMIDRQLGFNRYANDHGIKVRKLSFGYHAQQSLMHAKQLINDDAQIYLNKQLPCITLTDPLPELANNQLVAPEQQATHILYDHRAYFIADELYLVETIGAGLQLQNDRASGSQKELLVIRKTSTQVVVEVVDGNCIEVNDQEIQSYVQVSIGDCIRIKSHEDELMLIRVEQ
jgi:hypothetical protein